LAMTYTDYRAWYSHYVCTPYINRRKQEAAQFFLTGNPSPEWKGRTLFVILSRENDQGVSPLILSLPVAYKNKELEVRVISYP